MIDLGLKFVQVRWSSDDSYHIRKHPSCLIIEIFYGPTTTSSFYFNFYGLNTWEKACRLVSSALSWLIHHH